METVEFAGIMAVRGWGAGILNLMNLRSERSKFAENGYIFSLNVFLAKKINNLRYLHI